ncbi:MAG: putative metal-binding protein [Psychromonas sp.]|jgi:uncharacterized metal-binding protein|uniref:putative zinc-binding protein n=1 Tax=Psychromonas sp. TaxID=1884585 RepID=UPI0039E4915F
MEKTNHKKLPLVYSCSGCSSIAQLANQIAIELDRDHIAEMSCIAGVGGGVKPLLKKAKSGRKIIALDGCPLHCVTTCLSQHGIESTYHYTLTSYGIKKKYHMDFSPSDVSNIKKIVISEIGRSESA